MSKTLEQIADMYVAGEMPGIADVGLHDAVHSIAMVYEYDKSEVRAAISAAEIRAQAADYNSSEIPTACDEEE